MPSFPTPVEVTVPVLVMVRGLSVAGLRVTGPGTLVLIVLGIYLTLISTQQFPELALVAARPLNPSASNSPHEDADSIAVIPIGHMRMCPP